MSATFYECLGAEGGMTFIWRARGRGGVGSWVSMITLHYLRPSLDKEEVSQKKAERIPLDRWTPWTPENSSLQATFDKASSKQIERIIFSVRPPWRVNDWLIQVFWSCTRLKGANRINQLREMSVSEPCLCFDPAQYIYTRQFWSTQKFSWYNLHESTLLFALSTYSIQTNAAVLFDFHFISNKLLQCLPNSSNHGASSSLSSLLSLTLRMIFVNLMTRSSYAQED
jgi:hypothetical protein